MFQSNLLKAKALGLGACPARHRVTCSDAAASSVGPRLDNRNRRSGLHHLREPKSRPGEQLGILNLFIPVVRTPRSQHDRGWVSATGRSEAPGKTGVDQDHHDFQQGLQMLF